MRSARTDELERVFAGTNDLRRRVGQSLWLLRRSVTIARGERPLVRIFAAWASSAASTFRREEERLAPLRPDGKDARLRQVVAAVLNALADDVAGGDRRIPACLRTLESALDAVVSLLRSEAGAAPVHDHDLARALRHGATSWSKGAPADVVGALRSTATAVGRETVRARP